MRPVNLRATLALRLCLVAGLCFVLSTGGVLLQSQNRAKSHADRTLDLVTKQLNFQLLRIKAGMDVESRFPDWDALLDHIQNAGQCVTFIPSGGDANFSRCSGTSTLKEAPPAWFHTLHAALLGDLAPIEHPVMFRDTHYGSVTVTTDSAAILTRSWQDVRNAFALIVIMVASFFALVYIVVGRALAPANLLVDGLERLADGAFSHRLPDFSLSEFRRISEACNKLAHKVEHTLAERSELSQRLVNAQEKERRTLAAELHDEFGQNLTAISALSASIEKSLQRGCPEAVTEIRMLAQITKTMKTSLRSTLLHLRPAELDTLGLTECLRQLIVMWNVTYAGRTRFELDVLQEVIPVAADRAIHIFRIAQEGLTNAARHADASNVRLAITSTEESIDLMIEDDGIGNRTGDALLCTKNMGALNMNERVVALGGSIDVEARQGFGYRVCVRVPL